MSYALAGAAGALTVGASGAAITPAYGTGANRTAGNLLVLLVAMGGSTSPPAISGWTIFSNRGASATDAVVYAKIAAGADAAPTVPLVASTVLGGQLLEFSGSPSVLPIQDGNGGGAGTTATSQAVTAGAANRWPFNLVIYQGVTNHSAAVTKTITWGSFNNGQTYVETANNGATSSTLHIAWGYVLNEDPGLSGLPVAATGTQTVSSATSQTGIVSVVTSFANPWRGSQPVRQRSAPIVAATR